MARKNGKSDPDSLDIEHELPPAELGPAGEAQDLAIELEKLRAERDILVDRTARLQAEFDNARKRAAREQQDFREHALADAMKSLLPVLDSFDGALSAPETSEAEFRAGIELINRQVHDALAKLGLQPIEAQGAPFDPQVHQAVQMVETEDTDDNHVVDELQRGYKFKDRLLRPAMVRVARNRKQENR